MRSAAFPVYTFLAVAGASCSQASPVLDTQERRIVNEGYSLLYDLLSSEKAVNKILIIKSEENDVSSLVTRIAETARKAAEGMEAFAEADPSLKLDLDPLPIIEQETRAGIESMQAKEHIFSSGWKFELVLLISQDDALSYGYHMANNLAGREDHEDRKAFLEQLSKELEELRQGVIDLIRSRYNETGRMKS